MEERLPFKDPFGTVQQRKSDVDFQDVFGGPPRRNSSIHERGRVRADSFDYLSTQRHDLVPPRRHWSGPGEKPAFGEVGVGRTSSSRRRNFGDEFFNDIFPGSDSAGSTPKRAGKDVFSSTPGSPFHSPNDQIQNKYEPASSCGSSLPAQVSHSLKFSKSQHRSDDALSESYSFPTSPSASVSSSTANLRSDIHSLYHQNSSSRLGSNATKNSSKKTTGSASLDSYINSSNFHFSFYRWAGKGVSLKFHNMPKADDGESLSAITVLPEVVIQGVDLLTDNDDDRMSTATGASKGPIDMERMDDASLVKNEELEKDSLHSDITVESAHSTQREELQSTAESTSHVKNLHELMMDDVGKSGLESVHSQVEENEHKTKQQSDTVSEEKMRGKKVKEKVRDFIKRFNSEGSPKRDQKMRKKDKNKIGENRQGPLSPSVSESSREEKSHELKFEEAFVFAYSQLSQTNQVQQKVQENAFESSSEPQRSGDSPLERNQTFQPTSVGQTHEAQNESNLEDFEECLVEHSIEEPSEALNVSIDQDQTKISEFKIREWSKGKEGNIRSLLSTLQSVLWPGSGWKPVPLVSIIEAPAVKRAYQKALLCLHPDKLQQRGAAPHEKYIAERVFEILQEAWNQFTL
ncbi:J domain-containing protein required for chloroplast accumulation response 1 [Rhynchospora pubera]|uniref:J domain-containing protein required for chloroplast accumulation response 1 n=1 Tax=Rhynchospora pubera TaxID=906938 RepID=A0AAV8FS06_9POAL|nr:J domain-containing protein required for chloroplast accumulation response 1 [Rhynchospora pubera]